MNWGSSVITPDLQDTLVGKESQEIISLYETEAKLSATIDQILIDSKNPEIIASIKQEGLVRVRETLLIKIMRFLNNMEIITNDGTRFPNGALSIGKTREIRALKNELLEKITKTLVSGSISISPNWWIWLSLGIWKSWSNKKETLKRSRWVSTGISIEASTETALLEIISIWWEVAKEYNYNKVINADLSKVKSAKYLGIEWKIWLGADLKWEVAIGVLWHAWINRQQDPEVGINQINEQFRLVSKEIFNVTWAPNSLLTNKETFRAYIKTNIDKLKSDEKYGEFTTTNEQHLIDNLDFIVKYMEVNKFFGEEWEFLHGEICMHLIQHNISIHKMKYKKVLVLNI